MERTDTAARVIKADPHTIYQAFLDPAAIAKWRPPQGMECKIYSFDPKQGGTYRMAFIYTDQTMRGKTSEHEDVFKGRFEELVPDKRIVEIVEFESNDPVFAGKMKMTTILIPVQGGTEVTFKAENVPEGIKPEDHQAGMNSSFDNLAAFTE